METPSNEELAAKYEEENQAILAAYDAVSCEVIRSAKGEVVQAMVTYSDGTSEPIYHSSPREPLWPVSATSSTRTPCAEG